MSHRANPLQLRSRDLGVIVGVIALLGSVLFAQATATSELPASAPPATSSSPP